MASAADNGLTAVAEHFERGLAALDARRGEQAIEHFRLVLAVLPNDPAVHNNLGLAYHELERYCEALEHYRRAVALRPGLADPYNNIGNLLVELGRFDEAQSVFAIAVSLAPRRGAFHWNLAGVRRFAAGDPEIKKMETVLSDGEPLGEDDRMAIHFALSKAYSDCTAHEPSFRHLLAANQLKRRRTGYDESKVLGEMDRIARVFGRELFERMAGSGDPSDRPVFVVGMPRSGTTLVEQILAGHPGVAAAGERYDLDEMARSLGDNSLGFPEIVTTLDGAALSDLGTAYLAGFRKLESSAVRVTDKMPWNFRFLGLIALMLPNARIIHVMRDPVDTCLSCFSKLFARNQEFSYDLGELGRYYVAYRRLMDHWRQVLPPGRMIEVQYESLVADLEIQARRIVSHCGLPWNQSCLGFDKTDRPVRTASAVQVRQPLYQTAADRWRPYRTMAAPLLEALGELQPK